MTALESDHPPGASVTWEDSAGRKHVGIVVEPADTPPHLYTEGMVHVVETITSEIGHWLTATRLTALDTPDGASVGPGVVCDGETGG